MAYRLPSDNLFQLFSGSPHDGGIVTYDTYRNEKNIQSGRRGLFLHGAVYG